MAGSSDVAFFSANGSEFVEMFEGVAAARIRDLFSVARKNTPAIVFIGTASLFSISACFFICAAPGRCRSCWPSAVLWQAPPATPAPRAAADEIDAIGKARGAGGGDTGTQEREQGLMQMLYEMDGFESNKGVLVVGATNRVTLLDDALLRKGRFDMTIYMGRPSTNNRFKILQVRSALLQSIA